MIVRPSVVYVDPNADLQAALDAADSFGGGYVDLGVGSRTGAWIAGPAGWPATKLRWLTIPSKVVLRGQGDGTILTMPVPGAGNIGYIAVFDGATDAGIRNLQIQGQHTNEAQGTTVGVKMTGACARNVVEEVRFAGTTAANGLSWGVDINYVVADTDLGHHTVRNCTLTSLIGTSSGFGYAIHNAHSDHNTFTGNKFVFQAGQGRHHVYLSSESKYCIVEGNEFFGSESMAIQLANTNGASANEFNEIINNMIYGSSGIVCYDYVENNRFENNLVLYSNTLGISIYSDAGQNPAVHNVVANNTIHNPQDSGVRFVGDYNLAINNKIHGANQRLTAGGNTASGIDVVPSAGSAITANSNVIQGNVITGTTHWTAISITFSRLPCHDTTVVGNTMYPGTGSVGDPNLGYVVDQFLNDNGSDTVIDANVFVGGASNRPDSKVSFEDDYVMADDAIVTY